MRLLFPTILLAGLAACDAVENPNENPSHDQVAEHYVYAADLYKKVTENALAAKTEYGNAFLMINGTLNSIKIRKDGALIVIIDNGDNLARGVICAFAEDEAATLNSLQTGSEIRIKGQIYSYSLEDSMFGVPLQNCSMPKN